MKKLAIVTGYHIKNYGSALQAYATQRVINDMGIENECIQYQKKNDLNQALRIFNMPLLRTKIAGIKKKLYAKKYANTLGKNFETRNKIFDKFVEENFKISEKCYGYEELQNKIKEYDAVLLGSDQVWNPLNFGSHYYTLEFVPDDIPKIAYAPSFGVSKIPNSQKKQTAKYLNRIEYISVREKKGKEIIKELTGKEVPVVLDPTLLLELSQWKTVYEEEKIVKEPYIFCYFLGANQKHREFAKRLQKQTGYKIVTLPYMDEIVKSDFNFADEQLYEVGPSEFLNLINHAKYVCTDSFHGTVFSILHHKEFFTFNRYEESKKASTNSRLKSLLGLLEIENRLCKSDIDVEEIRKEKINYDEVDKKLTSLREESMKYLKNAIEQAIFKEEKGL